MWGKREIQTNNYQAIKTNIFEKWLDISIYAFDNLKILQFTLSSKVIKLNMKNYTFLMAIKMKSVNG